jgi:hypothetical protein
VCEAQRCPVCNGAGSVLAPDPYGMNTVGPAYRTCHGCSGQGWVVVHCINEASVTLTVDGKPVETLPVMPVTDGLGYFRWPP